MIFFDIFNKHIIRINLLTIKFVITIGTSNGSELKSNCFLTVDHTKICHRSHYVCYAIHSFYSTAPLNGLDRIITIKKIMPRKHFAPRRPPSTIDLYVISLAAYGNETSLSPQRLAPPNEVVCLKHIKQYWCEAAFSVTLNIYLSYTNRHNEQTHDIHDIIVVT